MDFLSCTAHGVGAAYRKPISGMIFSPGSLKSINMRSAIFCIGKFFDRKALLPKLGSHVAFCRIPVRELTSLLYYRRLAVIVVRITLRKAKRMPIRSQVADIWAGRICFLATEFLR
jgi:hypothetical protein